MARKTYAPKQSYVGAGNLDTYTFDFKIEALEQLMVVILNDDDEEEYRVRGDSGLFSSVTFNPILGGGSVTLAAGDLLTGYTIILLEANDEPTQPYQFNNKSSFDLKTFEMALDWIVGAVQRLAYLVGRSLKVHELDDNFDTTLPPGLATNPGAPIIINETGTGFKLGIATNNPGLIPAGGDTGAALVKASSLDGDVEWDDFVLTGFSSRFGAWSSVGLRDTLEKILDFTYLGPLIASFTGSSNSLREKGTSVSNVTLSVNVTKRANDIARILFTQGATTIEDMAPPVQTGSGTSSTIFAGPFTDTTTFTVAVTDAAGGGGPTTVTSNVTYSFVYPYYKGNGAPSRTAAQVAAMTKLVINSNANYNTTFTTLDGDVYYFAYPASYGDLVSILDENGFETFSSWTKRTENITGLDASAVSYFIYEFENPVVAGSTNFTFKR